MVGGDGPEVAVACPVHIIDETALDRIDVLLSMALEPLLLLTVDLTCQWTTNTVLQDAFLWRILLHVRC